LARMYIKNDAIKGENMMFVFLHVSRPFQANGVRGQTEAWYPMKA
jgi:hypothetical protein